jgi:Dolichyl-phosphate-mannose-protein mannosyltransferase
LEVPKIMADAVLSGQSKTITLVFLFFLVLGIFFRVYDLGQRNLWTDEAWVALAATQPTPAAALHAGKSTPPLYLLTVWGLVQAFGRSETTLRLTSCLLGLGALFLLWPLSRSLLPPWPALTAFALGSVSTRLVYFSKELKQYSADIFFAVLIFFLVERQLQRQGQKGWLWFTVLLALGLGFSHPLVFLLPVAALLLWRQLPQARTAVLVSFTALALVFFGYYWFYFRGQVDPDLLVYWQCDFPNVSCGSDFLCWLGAAWSRFGRYFFNDWGAPLGFLFLLAGLIYFARSNKPRVIWYFFGPLLIALAAAFARRYPFMGHAGGMRLMMFNAPMLLIVSGAGIAAMFHWSWRRYPAKEELTSIGSIYWRRCFTLILLALIIFWQQPVKLWQENLFTQTNREEIQPLLHYLEIHCHPGDAIYVYYFAIDPFKYYYYGPAENIIWGQSCQDTGLPVARTHLLQIERLWLVFSHFETDAFVDGFVAGLLGPGWTKQLELSRPGALLFCYLPPWSKTAGSGATVNPPKL